MTITPISTDAQILARAKAMVDPVHRAAIDRLAPQVRQIAGYHIGWWDAEGLASEGGGKAIRPALVLACARAMGGDAQVAVPCAVGIELVHDFSLLHDDVMDGDMTRRHRPAAWTVYGASAAILTGDALLALALDVLADVPGFRRLTGTLLELCAGQSADLEFEERDDITLSECLAMADSKTGALLGCACELGALAAGAHPSRAALMRGFGRNLGLAFQLTDDLLDIWGDPSMTGKPSRSDLSSRKKSLPVVAALNSPTPAGDRLRALYRGDGHDLDLAAELIEDAGGRRWAQDEADLCMGSALACLDKAGPTSDGEDDLRALVRLAVRRDH